MSVEQVNTVLAAVDLRERVLLHMAIFSGFRLGLAYNGAMWLPMVQR
jgi:hypothetical protein